MSNLGKPEEEDSPEINQEGNSYLIAGIAFGVALAAFIFLAILTWGTDDFWPVALSGILALAAIVVTLGIARQQSIDAKRDSNILENVHALMFDMAERRADRDYELEAPSHYHTGPIPEENSSAPTTDSRSTPTGPEEPAAHVKAEFRDALESKGAGLDLDQLEWWKKPANILSSPNPGWIVSSPDSDERWFVRRANGITARRAMPKSYFSALANEGLGLDQIRTEFQVKDHPLAAWYARTYSGQLWKISQSNRFPDRKPTATRVNE